jgi:hypothetical protein
MQSLLDLSSLGGYVRKYFQMFGLLYQETFKITQRKLAMEPYNRVEVYSNLVGMVLVTTGAAQTARTLRLFVWSQSFGCDKTKIKSDKMNMTLSLGVLSRRFTTGQRRNRGTLWNTM